MQVRTRHIGRIPDRLRGVCVAGAALLLLAACSPEAGDWRNAQSADSIEAYDAFVAKYPQSEFAAQATERTKQLGEERDWQTATAADTADAYQQFLSAYPDGKWSQEARVRIENFNVMQGGVTAPAPAPQPVATPAPAVAPPPVVTAAPAVAAPPPAATSTPPVAAQPPAAPAAQTTAEGCSAARPEAGCGGGCPHGACATTERSGRDASRPVGRVLERIECTGTMESGTRPFRPVAGTVAAADADLWQWRAAVPPAGCGAQRSRRACALRCAESGRPALPVRTGALIRHVRN
jgi:hypothetical protein